MVPVRTPDPVAVIGAYWAEVHHETDTELYALQTSLLDRWELDSNQLIKLQYAFRM